MVADLLVDGAAVLPHDSRRDEAALAVPALVAALLLVDRLAVLPHVARLAEAAIAVELVHAAACRPPRRSAEAAGTVRAPVAAPLLVHRAHVAVAVARRREGVQAVRTGVRACARFGLLPLRDCSTRILLLLSLLYINDQMSKHARGPRE